MIAAIAFALTAATPAAPAPVSVASGDWSNIPAVESRGVSSMSRSTMVALANALADECKVGKSNRVDLAVPFLIEFTPAGEVNQVVVQRINCTTAESLIGGTVLELARSGEYRPTGQNQIGWYRGEFRIRVD